MVFLGSAAITAGIQLTGFVAAATLQTEVFYDVLGGLNFLSLTLFATVFNPDWIADTRRVAVSLFLPAREPGFSAFSPGERTSEGATRALMWCSGRRLA